MLFIISGVSQIYGHFRGGQCLAYTILRYVNTTINYRRFVYQCLVSQSQLDESKSRPNYLKRHVAYIYQQSQLPRFQAGRCDRQQDKATSIVSLAFLFSPPLHNKLIMNCIISFPERFYEQTFVVETKKRKHFCTKKAN